MNITSVLNNYWILIPLIAWTLVWKGVALWKAARRNAKVWFVVLLVLNTLGILEIIYVFLITRKKIDEIQADAKTEDLIKKKII